MANALFFLVMAAVVLGPLVVLHEFGHFIVAKFFGVKVLTFSVGFGKRLWGFKRGDTDYRLSLIPLGGYVKMAGENLDEQITGAPDEFMSKPKWQRLCVAFAGPAMNILIALVIPAVITMIHFEDYAYRAHTPIVNAVEPSSGAETAGVLPGDQVLSIDGKETPTWRDVEDVVSLNPDQNLPITIRRGNETKNLILHTTSSMFDQDKIGESGLEPDWGPNTVIVAKDITPGSPADEAGLKVGDKLLAVNGSNLRSGAAGRREVFRAIRGSEGRPVVLTVDRDGQTMTITATPKPTDDGLKIGMAPVVINPEIISTKLSLIPAVRHSFDQNERIIRLTKDAIGQIFVGRRSARDTLAGPIQIAKYSGEAARQGATTVFNLMGVLSLNLGVFNLLPIPVLDGGLIFMIFVDAALGLFGLSLTLRIKEKMMQVGFVLLMLLMAFVIFNDVSKQFPSKPTQTQTQNK